MGNASAHYKPMNGHGNSATRQAAKWESHAGQRLSRRFNKMIAALAFVFSFLAVAQQTSHTIQGTVRESSGVPAGNASVRLEQSGASPLATKTKSDGTFVFNALASGNYVLIAEKEGRQSPPVTVSAASPKLGPVDLTLSTAVSQAVNPSNTSAPPMEFADKPNFTIAAVTDWTAAGGHGSDASLRTSEALNREALKLKPSANAASAAPPPADEAALRFALDRAPASFDANHKLGAFYLRQERFADSLQPLQAAYQLDPANSDNEYDLAVALQETSQYSQAYDHVQKLMTRNETADVYRLAGELDEKLNNPLNAVHELERAVKADPSEQNYFEWGSELLLHRAVWQARDIFDRGVKAYPQSERMLAALGAALFAGALYDESAQRLCQASDLNPADPAPYMFMGKIEMAAPDPLPCVEQKLARFVELRPQDPLANYFYAMTVWKQKGKSVDPETLERVQSLLTKAVTIDPHCGDAYLQLGVLEATRSNFDKAIGFYTRAIDANPQMSEAHYRLGVAYDRVGDKEKAAREFQLHDEIEKRQAAAVDTQRREVKQFLVVVNGKTGESNPR